jgi:hypothetical protein
MTYSPSNITEAQSIFKLLRMGVGYNLFYTKNISEGMYINSDVSSDVRNNTVHGRLWVASDRGDYYDHSVSISANATPMSIEKKIGEITQSFIKKMNNEEA